MATTAGSVRARGLWQTLLLLFSILAASARAQVAVPPDLHDWEAWVLHGHEQHRCPWLLPGRAADEARVCAWPGVLELTVDARGGHFTQRWEVATEAWLAAPGDSDSWPENVTLDARPAALVAHAGAPALFVAAGTHIVTGAFSWERRPEHLPVPREVALVALTLDGTHVALPQRDAAGVVLGAQPLARADNSFELQVYRLLDDSLPARLTTRLQLRVAGEAREVRLPHALPAGFEPIAIDGDLAARLDPDDTLRLQVRPGQFEVTLEARGPSPVSEARLGARSAPWPADEVWSFRDEERLRVVSIEGVEATDPAQAGVPDPWRGFPTYRMNPETVLRVVERSRGLAAQDTNELHLMRTAWLDFSGAGYTVVDHISGQMRQGWRLDLGAPYALEGARAASGEPLLVTAGMAADATGVEVREPQIDVTAVSRLPRSAGAQPASGWHERLASASGFLVLGPGYRLLAALGPDAAPGAWLQRWQLLDVFAALLIATVAWRLFGLRVAALALGVIVLTHQESGAATWLWLNLLVALALMTAAPEGWLRRAARVYRVIALVALLSALVPFALEQARLALYPQLESGLGEGGPARLEMPVPAATETIAGNAGVRQYETAARREEKSELAAVSAAPALPSLEQSVVVTASKRANPYGIGGGYEPGETLQAGPGLPAWHYHVYDYSWSGPVDAGATVHFVISPPWLTRLWRLAGIALSVWLLWMLTRSLLPRLPELRRAAGLPSAAALLLVLVGSLGALPTARAAATPEPALLKELQSRLLASPRCAPDCAGVLEADVSVGARLTITLTVSALDHVGVALPGADPNWAPDVVQVDGTAAGWVYRDARGIRYLSVTAGRHVVRLEGPAAGVEALALAFPLAPHVITVSAPGWDVAGIHGRRLVSGALELARRRSTAGAASGSRQEEFPPFVAVTRTFALAHTWTITTEVARVAPQSAAFTARVPLMPQEAVTTPGLEAREHALTVGLAAGEGETLFNSVIPVSDALELVAAGEGAYSEHWQFEVAPTWHVEFSGTPAVGAEQGSRALFDYYPRPGEHLKLAVSRPRAVAGGTVAFDQVRMTSEVGKRSRAATLVLDYRSTQGGRQVLHLPTGAEVTSVTSDGRPLALRPEHDELSLPALPGAHHWSIEWRSPQGVQLLTRAPAVALGAPAGNLNVSLVLPEDRWVLYAFGPGAGPAILYWGELLVFVAVAWLLGRSGLSPLAGRDWLLLGLGLSTFSWSVFALFVAFVAAFTWRSRAGAPATRAHFNLTQVLLAALAVVAVLAVVAAVPRGLLAHPDMRFAGAHGPLGTPLYWFLDRTQDALPRPSVLSVSLWWYKLAMLAWALWLSFALTRWIRWAWSVFTREGLWRAGTVSALPPAQAPPATTS